MPNPHSYEDRAEELQDRLVNGQEVTQHRRGGLPDVQCNMQDIWGFWRDERYPLLTGMRAEEIDAEMPLKGLLRADWEDFLYEWCLERAREERRPETYRHVSG